MGLIYERNPGFVNIDSRGKLIQVVSDGYCQVNYIESAANAVRGYHYHKLNREAFYITKGSLEIAVWKVDDSGIADRETFEVCKYGMGDFFEIGPLTAHVFTYLEDSALISLYDNGVELADGGKDIWKISELEFFQTRREGCS